MHIDYVLNNAIEYLNVRGILLPPDLVDDLGMLGAVKTVDYYTRVLTKLMRDLYSGKITEDQFVDGHAGYLERQVRRAFNVGMRENGLDPKKDMTPELEAMYQEWVIAEYQYIDRIASEIYIASIDGQPLQPFLNRADLWANRYTDIVNRAMIETGLLLLFMWELGETEVHCSDCFVNDGRIQTGQEWKQEPQPQSESLECGGWRCDCRYKSVASK